MTCIRRGCSEQDTLTWSVGHINVNACHPCGMELCGNAEIENLLFARNRFQRQLDLLTEALKGPAANVGAGLMKLEELLAAERALQAAIFEHLARPGTRPS